jgi:hypothetical protein
MTAPPRYHAIEVRRLRFASLFAMFFRGTVILFGPFILLAGIAALFGAQTLEVDGTHVTGVLALFEALLFIPLFAVGMALWGAAVCYVGVRVSSRFFSTVLEYIPGEKNRFRSEVQRSESVDGGK